MGDDPVGHDPVLVKEVLAALEPRKGQIFVDCTLGRGGHSGAIAPLLGESGLLIGIDVDPVNLAFARDRLNGVPPRARFFHASFAELDDVLQAAGVEQVDGILADLGLSTNQYLDPRYGLSFSELSGDAALDMRIDPRLAKSAADLVNSLPEDDLANVLYELAQERYSRRIARKIVAARQVSPIKSTGRLAELVRSAIPPVPPWKREPIDPATRTFMALRMAVNHEVTSLQTLLDRAPKRLKRGGRLAVISFHSTEDRLVKQAFRAAQETQTAVLLTRKPVTPSEHEISANPRSRSAKLRAIERV